MGSRNFLCGLGVVMALAVSPAWSTAQDAPGTGSSAGEGVSRGDTAAERAQAPMRPRSPQPTVPAPPALREAPRPVPLAPPTGAPGPPVPPRTAPALSAPPITPRAVTPAPPAPVTPGAGTLAEIGEVPYAAAPYPALPAEMFGPSAPSLTELSGFGRGGIPQMIGDQAPILAIHPVRPLQLPPQPPPLPPPGKASSFVASVRGLKISENQSPAPQDRVFYTFNFFAEVNQHLNQKFQASVDGLRVFREVMGFEKTFHDGDGSFGVRLPINTVSANSTITGNFAKLAGTSTAVGDLSFFAKYVFLRDPATGSLLTGGLAISTTNGPRQFAGAKYLASLDSTSIQPFVGYIWRRDRFYLHGFSAIDTPASTHLATMVFNDVGIGYFVLKSTDPQDWLTAIAPTFEVHVNSPLTHGDWTNRNDPGGVPNVVNLTYGINFEFNRRSILTFGMVTPVTGPRPFDYEVVALLNVFYGRTRRTIQGNLPVMVR